MYIIYQIFREAEFEHYCAGPAELRIVFLDLLHMFLVERLGGCAAVVALAVHPPHRLRVDLHVALRREYHIGGAGAT